MGKPQNVGVGELFGRKLVELREARGLSCNRLALQAGVNQPLLTQIELGKRRPTEDLVAKVACALDTPVDVLQAWADLDRMGLERSEALARLLHEEGH